MAALGVFGTGIGWPDIVVASLIGLLGLSAARTVIAQARAELKAQRAISEPQKKTVLITSIELKRH